MNGYDGLEVRRTRRSKRKFAAKPQATAFLRMQTSDSTKDSIEIKLPEAGQRREGTAKQPENFGAIISRNQMITMHVAGLARVQ